MMLKKKKQKRRKKTKFYSAIKFKSRGFYAPAFFMD